jgi:hypothetical protein
LVVAVSCHSLFVPNDCLTAITRFSLSNFEWTLEVHFLVHLNSPRVGGGI